uniref:LOB domain-containing protein 25-like n=1 Tax=Nicotiana tabacum TaxID=4097 RepID=A0A1S3ZWN3_TOBAC
MSSSSSYSNPPCAACKFLRRKCLPSCIFAPYFPPEEPIKFTIREDAYGCVGEISVLQKQVIRLQKELDATNADLMRYASYESGGGT